MKTEGTWIVPIILILLTTPLTFAGTSTSMKTGTVILVSDNTADWTMAELVSNFTGFPVVVTHWGIYNPLVSSRIYAYSPRRVIIIGGPLAVPKYYVEDMKAVNITVIRWWGENRYGTNRAVLYGMGKLGIKLSKYTVVSLGYDSLSVLKALKITIDYKAPLIYLNGSQARVNASIAVVSHWDGAEIKAARVVIINVTDREILALLNEVGQKIDALKLLINSTNTSDSDVSGYIISADTMLAKAKLLVIQRKYGDAYRLINHASYLIDRAIRITESNGKVGIDVLMGTMQLALHGIKSLNPSEYVKLQELMKEYREYLRKHNYLEAQRILMIIRVEIMKVYSDQRFTPAPYPGELLNS